MPDGIRWVGLDVHARESTFAIFDQATGEVITKRVVGRPHELLPWLGAVQRPARMVYEAGPTGYGLARRALAEGLELAVCAPGKTERPPADRVKTDKRVRREVLSAVEFGHRGAVLSGHRRVGYERRSSSGRCRSGRLEACNEGGRGRGVRLFVAR